jgi:hypothetical protein
MAFPVLLFTALASAIRVGLRRIQRKCCHTTALALH